MLESASPG